MDLSSLDETKLFTPLPPADYPIVGVAEGSGPGTSKEGNPKITLVWKIQDDGTLEDILAANGSEVSYDEAKNRKFYQHFPMHTDVGKKRFKATVKAVNPNADFSAVRPDDVGELIAGYTGVARIAVGAYQGKPTNELKEIKPAGIEGFLSR
jgi:hypothetical protein